jgi:hypothetical protein
MGSDILLLPLSLTVVLVVSTCPFGTLLKYFRALVWVLEFEQRRVQTVLSSSIIPTFQSSKGALIGILGRMPGEDISQTLHLPLET